MPWYAGSVILSLEGRLTQIWHISKVPPSLPNRSEWNSSWTMPLPAVIHCTSPGPMTPLFPLESPCSTSPWKARVTVSNPRWGWLPTPLLLDVGPNSLGEA